MSEPVIQGGVKKRPSPGTGVLDPQTQKEEHQSEANHPFPKKAKYVDDMTLYMAWHNWCLTEQIHFLRDFSMFQFSQNQMFMKQQTNVQQQQQRNNERRQINAQNSTSVEVKMASFKRRLAAELIDFFFLLFVKIFVITYVFGDEFANHFQYVLIIDENTTLEDLQMTLLQALLFRVAAIAYEGYCLSGTLPFSNGATIGKRIMGLDVIRCEMVEDIDAFEGRIRVFPGGPIGVTRSMIRATLKNAIISLFFPMLLPFQLMSNHNRLIYELAVGTIVVKKE